MIKTWLEKVIGGFIVKKGLAKGTKAATSAIVGLVAAALAKHSVQVWLTNLGVTIDPVTLEQGIAVAVTGAVATLLNYVKTRFNISYL